MKNSIAVSAHCAKCDASLEVGKGIFINERWMMVVQPCSCCAPKAEPKKPKKKGVKDYVYGDRAK